jgi:endoglucanase
MQERYFSAISMDMPRRALLKSMVGIAASSVLPTALLGMATPIEPGASINPKWYGFNLLEYFSTDPDWMRYFPYRDDGSFKEDDFRWMRDWGFNWVRLPMDYRFWTDPGNLMKIEERKIEPIDRAIRLGEKYAIHINICLHRAPGECCLDGLDEKITGIHITPEKTSLYRNQATLDAFVHQWVYFAERYLGISNERLSFNLVNEPQVVIGTQHVPDGRKEYARVARAAIAGIRSKDPKRLIVTDGYNGVSWGLTTIPELFDTGILQSCHDYEPGPQLTHYHNEWARTSGSDQLPLPAWPLRDPQGRVVADKQTLEEEFRPWRELAQHGIPIHFGEMGCYKNTPPNVVYSWFNDTLDVIGGMHSGWALWNFRGPFGILDTERPGTQYQNWHGHQLDFMLLRILQAKMRV